MSGIAHGWEGGAWIAAQLQPAGAARRRVGAAIEQRLRAPSRSSFAASLFGHGARAVVISAWRAEAPSMMEHWSRTQAGWRRAWASTRAPHDVMLGAAGGLLACVEIEARAPGSIDAALVEALHRTTRAELDAALSSHRRGARIVLGLAHGLAGLILALEHADGLFGLPLGSARRRRARDILLRERLDGPGAARWALWPTMSGAVRPDMHGWCHGAPGIALAMLWADALGREPFYEEICSLALEATAAVPSARWSFCCGAIGAAQVLLDAHRRTGAPRWRAAAQALVDRMPEPSREQRALRKGFHKGALGLHYLSARLRWPSLPLPGLGVGSVCDPVALT